MRWISCSVILMVFTLSSQPLVRFYSFISRRNIISHHRCMRLTTAGFRSWLRCIALLWPQQNDSQKNLSNEKCVIFISDYKEKFCFKDTYHFLCFYWAILHMRQINKTNIYRCHFPVIQLPLVYYCWFFPSQFPKLCRSWH